MPAPPDPILTVAQMRAAEAAAMDGGTSQFALMQRAGQGAAQWVRRVAVGRPVTVLCGPGNNGGDGYVIAQDLLRQNTRVAIVAPVPPRGEIARRACREWQGDTIAPGQVQAGGVFIDCLFGSGLSRDLSDDDRALLARLVHSAAFRIAIDLPSGVAADGGGVPDGALRYDLTLALGAWKFAHFTMPAMGLMGERRLVPIGIGAPPGAARAIDRPRLTAPARDAHKYTRGLAAIIGGAMPGAALLASLAAQHAGAGYVKVLGAQMPDCAPPDLVIDRRPLSEALTDDRIDALLIGPGLGRGDAARDRLAQALARNVPTVCDADALHGLEPDMLAQRDAPLVATPHEGELASLAQAFAVRGSGKRAVAQALARDGGMIVIAKGADTFVAAPDGRLSAAHPAPSWLATAGTGDVLAGVVTSRLATGAQPFDAACEAVWMHGEAARRAGPAFTAIQLATAIRAAYRAAL